MAVSSPLENFDPIKIKDPYLINLTDNVFETLLRFENKRPVPVLATDWTWYSDSLFVINIKEDILFSNNVLLSDTDIYKSMDRALNHPNSLLNVYKAKIDSFAVIEKSLYIYYNDFSEIFEFLSKMPIYSASHLDFFDDISLRKYPLSTGKYFLYSMTDKTAVFRKNVYHRDFSNHKQNPDIVEIIYEPDVYRQYWLLKNKEIDFVFQIPLVFYRDAFNDSELNIVAINSNSFLYMMLDSESDTTPDINLSINPLKEYRVRHAIAHAINIEGFVEDVLLNQANVLAIPIFKNIQGYPVNKRYYSFDIEYSQMLMAEAGFSDGFDLKIKTYTSRYTNILADFIRESLGKININVEIEILPYEYFFLDLHETSSSALIAEIEARDDILLEDLLSTFYYCPYTKVRGAYNMMNFENANVMASLDSLSKMRQFDTMRTEIYSRLTDIIYEEACIIPFFQPQQLFVSSKRVTFDYNENFKFTNFRIR